MLSHDLVDSLFPPGLPGPEHWEHRYPPRGLPEGAQVTRFSPSPTGYLHIGGVYAATIDVDVARHSGGVYLVRLEDTDQARVAEGAAAQFAEAFAYFSIEPDEDDQSGRYGPYAQSARAEIYLTYVRELLRRGLAYPCFATRQDLEEIAARQRAAGALPGYYGKWAIWRDADPERVTERLAAGDPYVVRFRSPGTTGERVTFTDAIRGELTLDDNRNDAVILKSSDTEPRLPTYHFAHAVDDHLMRISLVIRGEEWISSVPLHLQLFDALGFARVQYAHIALLMKQDGGSRRKLSKRKDPEASVSFYIEQGYPAPAVQYYLRGLANGRLAEMPLAEALAAPIRLSECGTAGPLVDMVKLDDICADYIATLPGPQILTEVISWAGRYAPDLAAVLAAEQGLALRALAIERDGVANPRKDLRKWADFRAVYGYFFPELFSGVTDPADARFGGLGPDLVRAIAEGFARAYQPPSAGTDWFDQIRRLAADLGFAPSQKVYRQDPAAYPGSIREVSQVIRVLLTGTPRSPDLAAVAAALGTEEVLRRVRALRLCLVFGVVVVGGVVVIGGRPRAQRGQPVQAVQVQLLGIGKHGVLLFLRLLGRLLGQFRRQATELAHADVIDEHMAGGENHDALHPPFFLFRRRKSGSDLGGLKWVRGMRGKLVALLDDPFVKFHYGPVKRQALHVFSRQAESPALPEAATVGHHGG
jgi:glutamyl-tRNA synthetase